MAIPEQQVLANNLLVLSHANELAIQIIMKVAGNDAANTLQGATITRPFIADAVSARLQAKLMPFAGGQ